MRKLTEAEQKQVLFLDDRGYGTRQIAEAVGCCPSTVRNVLKRHGRPVGQRMEVPPDAVREFFARLRVRPRHRTWLYDLREVALRIAIASFWQRGRTWSLPAMLDDIRYGVVLAALVNARGNKVKAAKLLGIGRTRLQNWLSRARRQQVAGQRIEIDGE